MSLLCMSACTAGDNDSNELQCPGNHGLKEFNTSEYKQFTYFNCDICQTKHNKNTIMFGCRICDYDLCQSCMQNTGMHVFSISIGRLCVRACPCVCVSVCHGVCSNVVFL